MNGINHNKIPFLSNRQSMSRKESFIYVKFPECKNRKAKYIVVSNNNESDHDQKVINQIFEKWSMKKPFLILSICGSNHNFPISAKLKNAFKNGIIKITESIKNTLVITGKVISSFMTDFWDLNFE